MKRARVRRDRRGSEAGPEGFYVEWLGRILRWLRRRRSAREEFIAGFAAELEDKKWIAIEFFAEQIVDGGDVLAGIDHVGAGALRDQVFSLFGEEGYAGVAKCGFDILRHFAGEELGDERGAAGYCFGDFVPILGGELGYLDFHFVGGGVRSLNSRVHCAFSIWISITCPRRA